MVDGKRGWDLWDEWDIWRARPNEDLEDMGVGIAQCNEKITEITEITHFTRKKYWRRGWLLVES